MDDWLRDLSNYTLLHSNQNPFLGIISQGLSAPGLRPSSLSPFRGTISGLSSHKSNSNIYILISKFILYFNSIFILFLYWLLSQTFFFLFFSFSLICHNHVYANATFTSTQILPTFDHSLVRSTYRATQHVLSWLARINYDIVVSLLIFFSTFRFHLLL